MRQRMIKTVSILIYLTAGLCSQITNEISENQNIEKNRLDLNVDSFNDITSSTIFIVLVSVFSVIIYSIILVVCCCKYNGDYRIDQSSIRLTYNNRFPNVLFRLFLNRWFCFKPQQFFSVDCFYPQQKLTMDPCYIIEQIHSKQTKFQQFYYERCYQCKEETDTARIRKFGTESFSNFTIGDIAYLIWLTIFMASFAQLFVRLATRNIIWNNYFCMSCGNQKIKIIND